MVESEIGLKSDCWAGVGAGYGGGAIHLVNGQGQSNCHQSLADGDIHQRSFVFGLAGRQMQGFRWLVVVHGVKAFGTDHHREEHLPERTKTISLAFREGNLRDRVSWFRFRFRFQKVVV